MWKNLGSSNTTSPKFGNVCHHFKLDIDYYFILFNLDLILYKYMIFDKHL